jgi:hypothetical protein
MSVLRVRLPRSPKPVEPLTPIEPLEPIVWHETGGWSLGWSDDAPGDYPTRAFARDVWLKHRAQHSHT